MKKEKIIRKNDIFLKRGCEYAIMTKGNKFERNQVITVQHWKHPFDENPVHYHKVKAYYMTETSWSCPDCDAHSTKNIEPLIDKKLERINKKYPIIIKKNVAMDGTNKKFNYEITTDRNKKIYINYFSTLYYTNVINERKIIENIRDLCSENKLHYIELNHISYMKEMKNIFKMIKKYSKKK